MDVIYLVTKMYSYASFSTLTLTKKVAGKGMAEALREGFSLISTFNHSDTSGFFHQG